MKFSKRNKVVSFDEEIVTKEKANELLTEYKKKDIHLTSSNNNGGSGKNVNKKKKQHHKKEAQTNTGSTEIPQNENSGGNQKHNDIPKSFGKKRKRQEQNSTGAKSNIQNTNLSLSKDEEMENPEVEGEIEPSEPVSNQEESIRAKKRRKHAQLLAEKKLKMELAMQQKCLNYLSLWKHNRSEWKFEKLRQVWLQQNMFDNSKIPDEFWETLVEYFNNSRGKAREAIIKNGVKLIEELGEKAIEDEEEQVRLTRARDIVQNLQE